MKHAKRYASAAAVAAASLVGLAAYAEAGAETSTGEEAGGQGSQGGHRSCDRPEGGWIVDPSKATEEDWVAANARARELGGDTFAGAWIEYIDRKAEWEAVDDPGPVDHSNWIFTVAYTGDPGAHEAELRELWGGGLCLVEAEHGYAELEEVRDTLMREFPEINAGGVDDSGNYVSAMAPEVTPELRAAIEERFGEGVVVLEEGEPVLLAD